MKDARLAAGLSQPQVSKELADAGIIPKDRYQTVSEWETERRQPNARELTWLRERYGVEIDWILSGRDGHEEAAAFRRIAAIVDEVRRPASRPTSDTVTDADDGFPNEGEGERRADGS
jgi:transcriptional regulator with XRE-family HTH domain